MPTKLSLSCKAPIAVPPDPKNGSNINPPFRRIYPAQISHQRDRFWCWMIIVFTDALSLLLAVHRNISDIPVRLSDQ